MADALNPEWRMEQTICSYDVDPTGTTRLPALCRFMQEAAYHHAEHLGLGHSYLSARGMAWVLARQRIEIRRLPIWGETIHLRTWPSSRDRLFFYRDFEIADSSGSRVLAATNAWSLIDVEKRARVQPGIYMDIELPEGEAVLGVKPARLKGNPASGGQEVRVVYGDLDLNGHVNNVRYLEWVFDALSQDFLESRYPTIVDANYLSEAVYGHTLNVSFESESPLSFHHLVSDGPDVLFRARTEWAPR